MVLLFLLYSLDSFGAEKEKVMAHLSMGQMNFYGEDGRQSKTIGNFALSFRTSEKIRVGFYTSTNSHHGLLLGLRMIDSLRVRYMMGNTRATIIEKNKSNTVVSFGLGLDYPLGDSLELSLQGFSYPTGGSGYNSEWSAGLSFGF